MKKCKNTKSAQLCKIAQPDSTSSHTDNMHYTEETVVVSYGSIEATVVRPDLECQNGYIHVIDGVMMKVGVNIENLANLYK